MWFLRKGKKSLCGSQQNLDYTKNFNEINQNLTKLNDTKERRKQFIVSILIIPAFYGGYELTIEFLNYMYWFLHQKSYLGFERNPLINPFVKLFLAILMFVLCFCFFKNFESKGKLIDGKNQPIKNNMKTWNYIFFIVGLFGYIHLTTVIVKSIDIDDLYNGVPTWKMLIISSHLYISLPITIVMFSIVYFMDKLILKVENNFIAFLWGAFLLVVSSLLIYILFDYIDMHRIFATKEYKETANYVQLKNFPNNHYYVLHCEGRSCFGYQVIDKDGIYDDILEKNFQPEDIVYDN